MPPSIQGLPDDKEVFGPPVAVEAAGKGIPAGLDAVVFQGRKLLRIALARADGVEDGQPGDAGEIADDVLDLQVHLGECFLEVLHMAAGIAGEVGPMAQEGAHGTDLFGRPKAGAQQADRVQILDPLAVADVGLAAGEIFTVPGIDQTDFQTGGFENLKDRNPINAGGLHGHGLHAALEQPIAQGEQVIGEGGEGADRVGIGVAGDGHLHLRGTDVNPGGMRMERGQLSVSFAAGFRFDFFWGRHTVPFVEVERRADGPKRVEASETIS